MKIRFKQITEKKVLIIGIDDKGEHEIGHIFTPSGSGSDVENAIQVCGFTEAFDLWGCGLFKTPKADQTGCFVTDEKGNKIYEQVKDIQLKFDIETEPGMTHQHLKARELVYHKYPEEMPLKGTKFKIPVFTSDTREVHVCYGCYNHPCTCELKVKHSNPYAVKKGNDLILLRKEKK